MKDVVLEEHEYGVGDVTSRRILIKQSMGEAHFLAVWLSD